MEFNLSLSTFTIPVTRLGKGLYGTSYADQGKARAARSGVCVAILTLLGGLVIGREELYKLIIGI